MCCCVQCVHNAGRGFRAGAYECECKHGYYSIPSASLSPAARAAALGQTTAARVSPAEPTSMPSALFPPAPAHVPQRERGSGGRTRRTTTAAAGLSVTAAPTALAARAATVAGAGGHSGPFSLDMWWDTAQVATRARPGRFPGALVEQAFVARALSNVQLRVRPRVGAGGGSDSSSAVVSSGGAAAAGSEEFASQFQCLPCPPGCDSCQSPSEEDGDGAPEMLRPCVAENDPLLRGVPLALQSFSITMCLILGALVFRLRRTKVPRIFARI